MVVSDIFTAAVSALIAGVVSMVAAGAIVLSAVIFDWLVDFVLSLQAVIAEATISTTNNFLIAISLLG